MYKKTISTQFHGKFTVDSSGCWLWYGTHSQRGYGQLLIGGRKGHWIAAHRIAMHLYRGFDFNSSLLVCHHCDVVSCVNPDHLFIGTQSDNCLDREQKGRGRDSRGENGPRAKLTWNQVAEIRERAKDGETQMVLAKAFGINQPHVSRIVRGENWRTE